jgi:hypothetical protein
MMSDLVSLRNYAAPLFQLPAILQRGKADSPEGNSSNSWARARLSLEIETQITIATNPGYFEFSAE